MTENDKKQPAKQALLAAAIELFTLKGYSAVSTRELADAADVNLGAITYHFGSKAQLFIATIHALMAQQEEMAPFLRSSLDLSSQEKAATALAFMIRIMLQHKCKPEGADVCRLMFREIHGATSQDPELYEPLLESVVQDYIRPFDSQLCTILAALKPESSKREIGLTAESILGQCVVYASHRPFIERLREVDLEEDSEFGLIAEHITRFTFRALELSEELINQTLELEDIFLAKETHE